MDQQPKKTYKVIIAKSSTFDEMQNAIRQMVNPNFVLSQEAYDAFAQQNEEDIVNRQRAVEALGPYFTEYSNKTDRESEKRKKELQDLAYFILFSQQDIQLVKMQESPDFILTIDGEPTGLELTSIHDMAAIKDIKYLMNLCEQTQRKLRENNIVSKKLYNIIFNSSYEWTQSLKEYVADLTGYLEARFLNKSPVKAAYIRELNISPLEEVQVRLSEVYETKPISASDVDTLIRQKEGKIADYRKNSGINRQWLLIIQEGSSAESSFEIKPELMPQRRFDFDRIILFDTFKGIAVETLDNPNNV